MFDLDSLNLQVSDPPLNETNKLKQLSLEDNQLIDSDGDLMMDELNEDEQMSTPMFLRNKRLLEQQQQQYLPHVSSPLRSFTFDSAGMGTSSSSTSSEFLDDEDDELMDIDETSNIINSNSSILGKSILGNVGLILSPTLLGAKVATHGNLSIDLEDLENQADSNKDSTSFTSMNCSLDEKSQLEEPESSVEQSLTSEKTINSETFSEEEEEGNTESNGSVDLSQQGARQQFNNFINNSMANKTPIQFQLHHHHHYYQSPNVSYHEEPVLPSPWGSSSNPKSPKTYIISTYLQLLFNTITSFSFLYFFYSILSTINQDIEMKLEQQTLDLSIEIASCARSYTENRCSPETRAHALEEICNAWESCMNKDPELHRTLGKSQLSAELIGLILNALVEPIGWKALLVCTIGVLGWSFGGNFLFGFVRAKSYYQGWNDANNNTGLKKLEPVYAHKHRREQRQIMNQCQNEEFDQSENHWQLQ